MTVSLGGITLDDNLALPGFKNLKSIPQSVHYGLSGGATVQMADPLEAGSLLTLEARQDGQNIYGYYTQTQVDQINALLEAKAAVALVHHLGSWTVLILDRSFKQVQDFADPGSADWYVGTITMIIT